MKDLVWDKIDDDASTATGGSMSPRGTYYIAGAWNCYDAEEMTQEKRKEGVWTKEIQITSLGGIFHFMRNEDQHQIIYPEDEGDEGTEDSEVLGPDEFGNGRNWKITDCELGDTFKVEFYRNPEDYEDMTVTWKKTGNKAVKEPEPRYFYSGAFNSFGAGGNLLELKPKSKKDEKILTCEVECFGETEEFQIIENKKTDRVIHPEKNQVTMQDKSAVMGPDDQGKDLNWSIGKSASDKYRQGDIFEVTLETGGEGFKVSWTRLRAGKNLKAGKRAG